MALTLANFVLETSETTGTGTINLAGATTGFQTFVAGAGDGAEVPYVIKDGTDWEMGVGTVTAGSPDTLSRDTVIESTNSDAAVSWSDGIRDVYIVPSASQFPLAGTDNTFTGTNTFEGTTKFKGIIQISDDGEKTISSGAITITGTNHTVDTEGDTASDDLDTIYGGIDGADLIIRIANDAREIVIKDGVGNIETPDGNNITLTDDENTISFIYDSELSKWIVTSVFRSLDSYYTKTEIDSLISSSTSIVKADANQSLNNGSVTKLNFNTTVVDVAGRHDEVTNNSRLTSLVDGVHTITATVKTNNTNNGDAGVLIYLNGSEAFEHTIDTNGDSSGWGMSISVPMLLTASDYVEFYVLSTGSSIVTDATKTQFAIRAD